MSVRATLRCPICGLLAVMPATLCACGYELETGDPTRAIAKLGQAKLEAHRTWSLGLMIVVATPLAFIAIGNNLLGLTLSFLQIVTGTAVMAAGIRSYLRVRHQLRAATTLRQLPEARLLR